MADRVFMGFSKESTKYQKQYMDNLRGYTLNNCVRILSWNCIVMLVSLNICILVSTYVAGMKPGGSDRLCFLPAEFMNTFLVIILAYGVISRNFKLMVPWMVFTSIKIIVSIVPLMYFIRSKCHHRGACGLLNLVRIYAFSPLTWSNFVGFSKFFFS